MIEAALKRTDKALADFREWLIKDRAEYEKNLERICAAHEKELILLEGRVDNKINSAINKATHRLTVNIGIMVSILTGVSLLLHYVH